MCTASSSNDKLHHDAKGACQEHAKREGRLGSRAKKERVIVNQDEIRPRLSSS